jgi:hypothetical protein
MVVKRFGLELILPGRYAAGICSVLDVYKVSLGRGYEPGGISLRQTA